MRRENPRAYSESSDPPRLVRVWIDAAIVARHDRDRHDLSEAGGFSVSRSGSRRTVTTPAPRKFKPPRKQHGEVRLKLGAVKTILGPLAGDACAWACGAPTRVFGSGNEKNLVGTPGRATSGEFRPSHLSYALRASGNVLRPASRLAPRGPTPKPRFPRASGR
jgi:hypothetical protein